MEDLLFDSDVKLENVGESTRSHQQDILIMHKGWNKFAPHLGVGIIGYVDDEIGVEELRGGITYEFERDGMDVEEIEISIEGKINTNASY